MFGLEDELYQEIKELREALNKCALTLRGVEKTLERTHTGNLSHMKANMLTSINSRARLAEKVLSDD